MEVCDVEIICRYCYYMFHETLFVEQFMGLVIDRRKERIIGIKNYICSKCDKKLNNTKKRYCNKCSAEYMRTWRKTHPLSDIQRFKNIVRRKTNMRIKRGTLIPLPCEICGIEKVEAHHEDYNKPYEIKWLCKNHHRKHHKNLIKSLDKEANGNRKKILMEKTRKKVSSTIFIKT